MIELMVVLVVMTILAGAIAPGIVSAIRRTGVKTAAMQLVDVLDFAYTAAIARRQPVTVSFDLERSVCWASVQGVSLPWRPEAESSATFTLVSIQLPEGIEISLHRTVEGRYGRGSQAQSEMIRFRPDGTAEDVVIELAAPSGDARSIEVVSATGQVLLTEER